MIDTEPDTFRVTVTPNLTRIDECIAWALTHPDEHDQAGWGVQTPCGTRTCIAGRAVLTYAPQCTEWRDFGAGRWHLVAQAPGEQMLSAAGVSYLAAELLGLNSKQADRMFMASNIEQVIHWRDRWAAAQGIGPYQR